VVEHGPVSEHRAAMPPCGRHTASSSRHAC
jgi:hypothetical protein